TEGGKRNPRPPRRGKPRARPPRDRDGPAAARNPLPRRITRPPRPPTGARQRTARPRRQRDSASPRRDPGALQIATETSRRRLTDGRRGNPPSAARGGPDGVPRRVASSPPTNPRTFRTRPASG